MVMRIGLKIQSSSIKVSDPKLEFGSGSLGLSNCVNLVLENVVRKQIRSIPISVDIPSACERREKKKERETWGIYFKASLKTNYAGKKWVMDKN